MSLDSCAVLRSLAAKRTTGSVGTKEVSVFSTELQPSADPTTEGRSERISSDDTMWSSGCLQGEHAFKSFAQPIWSRQLEGTSHQSSWPRTCMLGLPSTSGHIPEAGRKAAYSTHRGGSELLYLTSGARSLLGVSIT